MYRSLSILLAIVLFGFVGAAYTATTFSQSKKDFESALYRAFEHRNNLRIKEAIPYAEKALKIADKLSLKENINYVYENIRRCS